MKRRSGPARNSVHVAYGGTRRPVIGRRGGFGERELRGTARHRAQCARTSRRPRGSGRGLAFGSCQSARAYRERVGADIDVRVGIVLQELVDADVAGVLFTCNPVTGADEILIEASWGLGEAIVQGLVIPDRYRLARSGHVLEAQTGVKDIAVRLHLAGHTRQEPVTSCLVESHCLGEGELVALHDLAGRCDETFGAGPHDLEWAFEGKQLFLLQRRPVTNAVARPR